MTIPVSQGATKKRRKRRANGTGCTIPRCRRLRYTEVNGRGMCAKHAADSLFAAKVRARGRCIFEGEGTIGCNGAVQCGHIVSRRYGALRWKEVNAVPLCMAHHVYYTNHPLEWEEFWGGVWDNLRERALDEPPERPEDVIERLRAPSMKLKGL